MSYFLKFKQIELKRTLSILASCALVASVIQAQEFAPLGSTWHYKNIEAISGLYEGYLKITTIGDTLIQGRQCRILEKLEYRTNGAVVHEGFHYLSVEGDTVWRYADDGQFYIIYNFAANPGESWTTRTLDDTFGNEEQYTVTVDSVSTMNVNGIDLRMQYCSTDHLTLSWFNGEVVERLGGLAFMFPFNYAFLDWDIRLGLRCYSDSLLGQYNSGIASDCESLITQIDENETYPFKLYPNPSTGQLTLEFGQTTPANGTISILGADGRLMHREQVDGQHFAKIQIEEKGVYLIQWENAIGLYTSKLIVQ